LKDLSPTCSTCPLGSTHEEFSNYQKSDNDTLQFSIFSKFYSLTGYQNYAVKPGKILQLQLITIWG